MSQMGHLNDCQFVMIVGWESNRGSYITKSGFSRWLEILTACCLGSKSVQRSIIPRDLGRSCKFSYDLASEVLESHIQRMLLVNKSLGSA